MPFVETGILIFYTFNLIPFVETGTLIFYTFNLIPFVKTGTLIFCTFNLILFVKTGTLTFRTFGRYKIVESVSVVEGDQLCMKSNSWYIHFQTMRGMCRENGERGAAEAIRFRGTGRGGR